MNGRMIVLIAYDGSDYARAALSDLRQAGLPREAEALVVSVSDVWVPPVRSSFETVEKIISSERAATVLAHAEEEASRALEKARWLTEEAARRLLADFPEWDVRVEVAVGMPAQELIQKAGRWKADLVVVGSHGRSALGRLIHGSVSQKVAKAARCSVRITRRVAQRGDSPVRIIVGTDGSPGADDAVRAVATRLWPGESEVRLVTALKSLKTDSAAVERQLSEVRCIQQAAGEQLRGTGAKVSQVVRKGEAKDMLIEEAKSWGADCIFVGSGGLGNGLTRYLLGSVSNALVKDAPCSVEVVRPRREITLEEACAARAQTVSFWP